MPVKIYPVLAGTPLGPDVGKILGFPPETVAKVNVLAFEIEGGVMEPRELEEVDEETRHIANQFDPQKPVIITGRGPTWLYDVLVHNTHFLPEIAIWDPRMKKAVIIHSTNEEHLGKAVTIDGEYVDANIPGASGNPEDIIIKHGDAGNIYVIHVELKQRFVQPKLLKHALENLPEELPQKPVLIEGLMPIWLHAGMFTEIVHKAPAVMAYDPRMKAGVVVASHAKEYRVGEVIPVQKDQIDKVKGEKRTGGFTPSPVPVG